VFVLGGIDLAARASADFQSVSASWWMPRAALRSASLDARLGHAGASVVKPSVSRAWRVCQRRWWVFHAQWNGGNLALTGGDVKGMSLAGRAPRDG